MPVLAHPRYPTRRRLAALASAGVLMAGMSIATAAPAAATGIFGTLTCIDGAATSVWVSGEVGGQATLDNPGGSESNFSFDQSEPYGYNYRLLIDCGWGLQTTEYVRGTSMYDWYCNTVEGCFPD